MQAPISRARYMQENRNMRFEEAYQGWTGGRLTQAEAALLLGSANAAFAAMWIVTRRTGCKACWTNA